MESPNTIGAEDETVLLNNPDFGDQLSNKAITDLHLIIQNQGEFGVSKGKEVERKLWSDEVEESLAPAPLVMSPAPSLGLREDVAANRVVKLEIQVKQQHSEIGALYAIMAKMAKQVEKLAESQKAGTSAMDAIRAESQQKVETLSKSLNEKIDRTLDVHTDIPQLMEKMRASTEQMMALLPKETRETLTSLEITPREQIAVKEVKARVAAKRSVRLPAHMRFVQ